MEKELDHWFEGWMEVALGHKDTVKPTNAYVAPMVTKSLDMFNLYSSTSPLNWA